MVKYLFLIFISFYLGSCAIQGSITGGPNDKKAPHFDTLKVHPPIGTVQFKAHEIQIPFDEFIQLNKPSENIIVIPNDFKIDPVAKDRHLTLRLKGEPKENTTYAIYLNNAVKDIHEGNDTLLTYVFSTGAYIDSLQYSGKVIDVRNRLPFKGAYVALFSDTVTSFQQKACNFTTSNDKGEYTLKYIHPGTYYLVAFQDQNRDFIPQSHEISGFKTGKVNLSTSIKDTSAIELFPSLPKKALRKINHIRNDEIIVTGNIPIDKADIRLFSTEILDKKIHRADSISIFINSTKIDTLKGTLLIDNYIDSFYCRIQPKQIHKLPTLYFPSKVKRNQSWTFTTNDFIKSINKDSIQLFANDSIKIPFDISGSGYKITIQPSSYMAKNYKLILKSSGLTFTSFEGKFTASQPIPVVDSTQYGIFNIPTTSFPEGTMLELISSDKVTHRHTVDNLHSLWKIDDVEKGTYVIKAYFDTNKNGKWDTGNLQNQIQPEKIQIYNEPFQARQNWELDIVLDPSKWK
jgi:uncharacterized protein (DUF2141 family)